MTKGSLVQKYFIPKKIEFYTNLCLQQRNDTLPISPTWVIHVFHINSANVLSKSCHM